jgi:hypothetical protein
MMKDEALAQSRLSAIRDYVVTLRKGRVEYGSLRLRFTQLIDRLGCSGNIEYLCELSSINYEMGQGVVATYSLVTAD